MADDGLRLPANLGAPERTPVNNKIHARWDTYMEVEEGLAGGGVMLLTHIPGGFTDSEKPAGGFPSLTPKQLTDTPNKDYTALHGEYLEWFRYTAETYAKIRAQVLQVKNEMEDIELDTKREMRNQPGKKPTEEEINIAVGLHSRYRSLKQLQQKAEQTKILLEVRVDYLERSLRVISRQVELRKIDANQGGVNSGMPMRNGPPMMGGQHGFQPIRSPGGQR